MAKILANNEEMDYIDDCLDFNSFHYEQGVEEAEYADVFLLLFKVVR